MMFLFQRKVIRCVSLLLLLLLLSACGGSEQKGSTAQPTATSTVIQNTQADESTPDTKVKPGVQQCPETVASPSHWGPILGVQQEVNAVEQVSCAHLTGKETLQALVTVRYTGTGGMLDVYVFDDLTSPSPRKLLTLQGLYNGEARISSYSTVVTGEVDTQKKDGNKRNLGREFKWSPEAGGLVQVAFPGIYPEITRYEAEEAQKQVDQGHEPWRLDAAQVAKRMAVELLKLPEETQVTVIGGGKQGDNEATATVKSPRPGTMPLQVRLSRLEGDAQKGIWLVTAVTSQELAITTPGSGDRVSSPATVAGKGRAFEAVIGEIKVLDHTAATIGQAQARGKDGMGETTFTTQVSYQSPFKNGAQEGLIGLFTTSNADGSIAGVALVKVLLL
uniref:Bacterial spore germination immunoglobulin-like domain-containing protein n=1 Tax=Thermosporothrix sp. COM3 TaxID=2490863 RepID=A0A455SZQ7_9CHLR|nr:hypothetical protein KTC_53150 [Thermosporothrix sp. COM3]